MKRKYLNLCPLSARAGVFVILRSAFEAKNIRNAVKIMSITKNLVTNRKKVTVKYRSVLQSCKLCVILRFQQDFQIELRLKKILTVEILVVGLWISVYPVAVYGF